MRRELDSKVESSKRKDLENTEVKKVEDIELMAKGMVDIAQYFRVVLGSARWILSNSRPTTWNTLCPIVLKWALGPSTLKIRPGPFEMK